MFKNAKIHLITFFIIFSLLLRIYIGSFNTQIAGGQIWKLITIWNPINPESNILLSVGLKLIQLELKIKNYWLIG